MSFISSIRNWLYDPRVRDVNVDDEGLLQLHASILAEKPILRSTFNSFYDAMLNCSDKFLNGSGIELELGSGAGFFKTRRPQVVTSDIRSSKFIDRALDAQNMDLPDSSVRCIYAINVFHHLPEPELFFKELERVLIVGGGCILIEPHNGFASAALHRLLHKDERFDPDAIGWKNSYISGPLSGANQALAHIVFTRDRAIFESTYRGKLDLIHCAYLTNGLRYLLSGGLNFRQLVPTFFLPVLNAIEKVISPFARFWSLHQIIVIKKSVPEVSVI